MFLWVFFITSNIYFWEKLLCICFEFSGVYITAIIYLKCIFAVGIKQLLFPRSQNNRTRSFVFSISVKKYCCCCASCFKIPSDYSYLPVSFCKVKIKLKYFKKWYLYKAVYLKDINENTVSPKSSDYNGPKR